MTFRCPCCNAELSVSTCTPSSGGGAGTPEWMVRGGNGGAAYYNPGLNTTMDAQAVLDRLTPFERHLLGLR